MKEICRYAIIRFRPFSETGEFANVGILAYWPGTQTISYRLAPRRFRRVSQFFDTLDPKIFSSAIHVMRVELDALVDLHLRLRVSLAELVSTLMQRRQDSILSFSEARTLRSEDSPDNVVEELFERYVRRNFVSAEYNETLMVKEIKSALRRRNILGFKARQIDDELVPVTLPLVSIQHGTWVIKPIALDQKTPMAIIDHAATWSDRFRLLFKRGRLDPEMVMLPISGPAPTSDAEVEAYWASRHRLGELGLQLVERADVDAIADFARRGAEPELRGWHP